MCKNCKLLPNNRLIRNPDEFFSLLDFLNHHIDEGDFRIISQTFQINDLLDGEIDNPFRSSMALVIKCEECGEYYTCAYEKFKGAGFWNRAESPY